MFTKHDQCLYCMLEQLCQHLQVTFRRFRYLTRMHPLQNTSKQFGLYIFSKCSCNAIKYPSSLVKNERSPNFI